MDAETRKAEGERRGRKRTRDGDVDMDDEDDTKVKLGKRGRKHDASVDLSDDETEMPKGVRTSISKRNMRMTPEQRRLSVRKQQRDRSASRREGSEPQRLAYKPVPDEHVRLAKKINAQFKHKIARSEADRDPLVKRPKHLYSGKMSNGTKDWR